SKDPSDRIVRLTFRLEDLIFRRLIVQLTGRSADLFIADELNRIEAVLREDPQIRQNKIYEPPTRDKARTRQEGRLAPALGPGSPSAQLDAYFTAQDTARRFDSAAKAIRAKLTKSIRQQRTLREHLEQDLARHGDANTHKRIGDLLLANIATARRDRHKVLLTDYYAEDAPTIELEVDENRSLQEEAALRFRQYTKAKHAGEEIAARLDHITTETAALEARLQQLDQIIASRDEAALDGFEKPRLAPKTPVKKSPKSQKLTGVRRYLSTDGYEILVGRAARDNDNLTFRIAQPNDLWMHTGDYPGSHVVVRNPTRKEIPQRTIIEAAQLAGRFSQASEDAKVVVHYTERKFLSKPKGAAPGLVRLSRFRSITVEPKEGVPRL
ncbi:MAG TPA: NFACT RNA binding domain-containing protein, partial [Pyrinomonadaceae bacterium]|nr:NFACT RNA binding domain-containing protein [Pyrinomonadaceae bacterium]